MPRIGKHLSLNHRAKMGSAQKTNLSLIYTSLTPQHCTYYLLPHLANTIPPHLLRDTDGDFFPTYFYLCFNNYLSKLFQISPESVVQHFTREAKHHLCTVQCSKTVMHKCYHLKPYAEGMPPICRITQDC